MARDDGRGLCGRAEFYTQLGGKMDKVISALKKYLKNKTSLSKKQVDALAGLLRSGGTILLNAVGLGSCWALVTRNN